MLGKEKTNDSVGKRNISRKSFFPHKIKPREGFLAALGLRFGGLGWLLAALGAVLRPLGVVLGGLGSTWCDLRGSSGCSWGALGGGLGAQLGDSGVVLGDFAGSKTLLGSSWFRFLPAVQFGFDFESLWGSSWGCFGCSRGAVLGLLGILCNF